MRMGPGCVILDESATDPDSVPTHTHTIKPPSAVSKFQCVDLIEEVWCMKARMAGKQEGASDCTFPFNLMVGVLRK